MELTLYDLIAIKIALNTDGEQKILADIEEKGYYVLPNKKRITKE